MTVPSFAAQQQAWSSPPVDDIGYLPSRQLLALDDGEFCSLMEQMQKNRYRGWRNQNNRWLDSLRIDRTHGKRVLDYGCGTGIEALRYAPSNQVWAADIAADNLRVAERLFRLWEQPLQGTLLISEQVPFLEPPCLFDVIHCSGVLHHIVDPVPVVREMAGWLANGGELRLMLYSDQAWITATGEPPPDNVADSPLRERFVRRWDAVGDWADWYNQQRLKDRFGQWFDTVSYEPILPGGEYVGAVLAKTTSEPAIILTSND